MDYRILNLIQQDRSAGIHDPEVEELDPRVLEVFQWLEERKDVQEKEAADLDLDEAIDAVGGHEITEARGQKDRGRGMGPVPVGRQSQLKTWTIVLKSPGQKSGEHQLIIQAQSKNAAIAAYKKDNPRSKDKIVAVRQGRG